MDGKKDLFKTILDMSQRNEDIATIEKKAWAEFGRRCAILVLDSSGFTRITKERGVVYFLSRFIELTHVLKPIFNQFGSISFRSEADNIFGEFNTPTDAYQAAAAANEALIEKEFMMTEDEPFQICIGIGYGEVLYTDHYGVFGDEMNLASKLGEDMAKGGEILLTPSAHEHLDSKYQKGFSRSTTTLSGVSITYYKHRVRYNFS